MEFDREGNRYDVHHAANPDLAISFDGDYFKANWSNSGILEADCLLCHMDRFKFNKRTQQLKKQNFKWAATAGSGLARVKGAVAAGETPELIYNKRFFNDDGTVVLDVSWPPPDSNCLNCHSKSDVKKRGFSWNDVQNPDVHNQQGLHCVACHHAGLDHQIAKGNANVSTVRDDLDNTILTCEQCHNSGHLGASIPRHETVRPSHLKRISCEACHIPSLGRSAALGLDAISGNLVHSMMPADASKFGEKKSWQPIYERREDGKLYPVNPIHAVWIGNKDAEGIIHPLFGREHKKAFQLVKEKLEDDDKNGVPEANTDQEIIILLKGVADSLAGNKRFKTISPVYVKGGFIYEMDGSGSLARTESEIAHAHGFSITHNVAPAKQALGAKGCTDCHDCDANFFAGMKTIDMVGADGNPVQERVGCGWGCTPLAFKLSCYYQKFLSPYVGLLIILVLFFVVVHYHSFGPKTLDHFTDEPAAIQRFTLSERIIHLARMISFFVLGATGLIWAYSNHAWMKLLFGNQFNLYWSHVVFGFIFAVATIIGAVFWWKDAFFSPGDLAWLKKAGGYLKPKSSEEIPSGRFNAGQKMFYWYTTVVGLIMLVTGIPLLFKDHFSCAVNSTLSITHNFFAHTLIAGVLAHLYLGVIANPGTWRVLVDGLVSKTWAKHHHPNWYRQITAKDPDKDTEKTDADS